MDIGKFIKVNSRITTHLQVVIPGGTVVYPGAVITPELAQTVVSFARDNPVSKMVLAKDPGGLETAAANKIAGSEQAADVILIKQVLIYPLITPPVLS